MQPDMSFTHLISSASLFAQFVLILLVLASIFSWALIFSKRKLLKQLNEDAVAFDEQFWSGGNLADLHEQTRREENLDGVAAIFSAGFEEYTRQQAGGRLNADEAVASIQRQMKVAHVREVERAENGLSVLATIGSVSPYVGLLGTVWGIMNAFIGIGQMQNASLAVVAPGIAEALIATAMGLVAAIPAYVAYNMFTRSLDRLENRYATFADEMIGIVERSLQSANRA
jgi:biopolymer transport protein TolQ